MRSPLVSASLILTVGATNVSYSYAPSYVDCPEGIQLVRGASNISQAEGDFIHGRKAVAAEAFAAYLTRLNLTDFDVESYTSNITHDPDSNMPTIAWATSGGAWLSAFTGAGGLRTLDSQTPGANEQRVGGLLQSLTYIAGLSGGSWPTASYALGDYPSIDDMVASWQVEINRFTADTWTDQAAPVDAYFETMTNKFEAGFNISASDLLGRAFAYQFVPGVNVTFSSITELSGYKNFSGPFPLLQSSSVNSSSKTLDGLYVPSFEDTLYEWNPLEFGSWQRGFVPTRYVGTVPDANNTAEKCVVGLDDSGFVMASVAAAYNYWYLSAISNGTLGQFSKRNELIEHASTVSSGPPSLSAELIDGLNAAFNETFGLSVSQIVNPSIPNPFGGTENITLVDNSEGITALPLWGLIQPSRKVDLILAWDADGDAHPYSWSNGTNLYANYQLAQAAGLPFPIIPPPATFLARNYTLKPTLFGCNTSLTTTGTAPGGDHTNASPVAPIVAYLANAPYSWYSNYSGFTMNMTQTEFQGVLDNQFNLMTQGNGTLGDTTTTDWVTCLGCAAVDRSLARIGQERTEQCEKCFAEWCWDGSTEEVAEGFVLDPSLQLDPSLGFEEWVETHPFDGGPVPEGK